MHQQLDNGWQFVREALLIIQRLQHGPADKATLIRAIQAELPEALNQPTAKAQSRHFERLLDALRHRLHLDIAWNRTLRAYELRDLGPYFKQTLSPDALRSLNFLIESFDTNSRLQTLVEPLLHHIHQGLPLSQQRELARLYPIFRVDGLPRATTDLVDPAVWQTAQTAVAQHRLLRFNYLTPKHDNGPVRHTVEPFDIVFRDGHTYLNAFGREWVEPSGRSGAGKWTSYRLDYIQKEGLQVLPTTFPVNQRSRRMITVRYKVDPQIGRGNMAQIFEEMSIVGEDKDGWVIVQGKATSAFEAYRTLMRLGKLCLALEPPELVNLMRQAAEGMMQLYSDPNQKEEEKR